MILTKTNQDGYVIAYAEFRLVDESGNENPRGEYAWINQVWVHKTFRDRNTFNNILKEFINLGAKSYPWCNYIYWQREKHGNRMSLYSRPKILRRSKNGKDEITGHDYNAAGADAYANSVRG